MTNAFRLRSLTAAAIALLVFACADAARAENWPGWRGPNTSGISPETDIPLTWSDSANVLWKTPLAGSGTSSPIVWDDHVYVTASDGPKRSNLHVVCLSRDDGKELWHREMWGTAPTLCHGVKSCMATPAPVTDGRNVYAFFGTGDVFAFDRDGKLLWQRSLAEEYGVFENRFAATSSPVVFDGAVIVQCDHYGASYLIALDGQTGANRWKADRPGRWHSWSSPLLIQPAGSSTHELIVSGSNKLEAFNPADGKQLWTVEGMSRECIPTPLFGNNLIYAVSGPKGPTLAVRPGGRGNVTGSHVAWRSTRGSPFVPSGIVVGERYFLVDDKGIATCMKAADGTVLWQKRLSGEYTASPVSAAGRVYVTNEAGETLVIAAGEDKYHELSRNAISEPVFASPAISQGRFFLRTSGHLFCLGSRAQ